MQRSMLYLTEKKYKETIDDLSDALKNRPNDPSLLYKRGEALYLDKDFRQALDNLEAALSYGPEASYEPDIHYHIGLSHANLEEFEYSISPFSRAIDLCPLEAVYYHERAKAYLLTEEYEMSVEDFDKVIELQPTNSHAFFGRAFSHKNLRLYDKASEDFERAKELNPDDPQLIVNYKKIYSIKFIKLCEPGEEMV